MKDSKLNVEEVQSEEKIDTLSYNYEYLSPCNFFYKTLIPFINMCILFLKLIFKRTNYIEMKNWKREREEGTQFQKLLWVTLPVWISLTIFQVIFK